MVEKGAGGDRSKHMMDLEAELRLPSKNRSERLRHDRDETISSLFDVSHVLSRQANCGEVLGLLFFSPLYAPRVG